MTIISVAAVSINNTNRTQAKQIETTKAVTNKIEDPIDIVMKETKNDVGTANKTKETKQTNKEKSTESKQEPSVSETNIPAEPVVAEEVIEPEKEYVEEVYIEPAAEVVYQEPVYIEPQGGYVGTYEITAYTWTDNTMANGEYPYYGSVASCDFALGTTLYIEGVGTFVVNDVCPSSGVIDVYMDSYDACINFGRMSANVYIQ